MNPCLHLYEARNAPVIRSAYGIDAHLFGTTLGCVIIPGSIVGMWRAVRMGVVIDTDGIRIRGFDDRDHGIPWSEVQSIGSEQVDVRGGLPLFAPVLHSCGGIGAFAVRALGRTRD